MSVNVAGKVDDKDSPRTGQGSGGMIKAIYQATPFVSPGIVDGRYIVNSASTTDNLNFDQNPQNMLPFVGSSPMTYYAYQPGGFHDNANKLSFDLILDQKLDFITKGLSAKLKGLFFRLTARPFCIVRMQRAHLLHTQLTSAVKVVTGI